MSRSSPRKFIALFISVVLHGALVFYLGKMALDYALPEGNVTSFEVGFEAPRGEQLDSTRIDLESTPPPMAIPTPQPAPPPPPAPTPTKAPPAQEAVATTPDPEAIPTPVEEAPAEELAEEIPPEPENVAQEEEPQPIPATDPIPPPEDVVEAEPAEEPPQAKPLAETLPTKEGPTEGELPPEGMAPVAGQDTTQQAYGRPDGVLSDAVLSPVAGNKKISYPTMARFRKLEGETIVHYTVGPEGSVTDVKLVQSSGHNVLDDSVINTIKGWKFNPTGTTGVYERPVQFSLKGDAVPAPSQLRRANP